MTYAQRVGGYFMAFAAGLVLLYSALIFAFVYVGEDLFYERLLQHYAGQIALPVQGNVPSVALIDSAVYTEMDLPVHFRGIGTRVVEIEDVHVLARPLENGATLLLSLPEVDNMVDVLAPSLQFMLMLIGAIVLVLGAVAALCLARQISRPLVRLADDVRAAGQSQVQVAVCRRDVEINQLACGFNAAVEQLARAISREKSFTRSVSHELRNPLTVLSSDLEILRLHPEPQQVLERVTDRMHRAVQSMKQLTRVFLVLARNDRATLAHTAVDVEKMLLELIEAVGGKSHDWQIDIQPGVMAQAAPELLEVLLRNLVENARNYATGSIRFEVDRFGLRTLNACADRPAAGSGLGLELVQRICDSLGWPLSHRLSALEFELHIMFHDKAAQ